MVVVQKVYDRVCLAFRLSGAAESHTVTRGSEQCWFSFSIFIRVFFPAAIRHPSRSGRRSDERRTKTADRDRSRSRQKPEDLASRPSLLRPGH